LIIRLQSADANVPTEPSSAWPEVETIQRSTSSIYHLVTQPDHAQISGAIAAEFDAALEPDLTPDVVRAIALHDHGWAQFEGYAPDCRQPLADRNGRPLSFLDVSPEVFLQAWSGSIHAAARTGLAGEYIVRQHFRTLAERRLRSVTDPPESTQRLRDFIVQQAEREIDIVGRAALSEAQLRRLLKLLQFCDIISLVICSGAPGTLDFPDEFCIGPLRLSPTGVGYKLERLTASRERGSSPLTAEVRFKLPVFELRDGSLTPLLERQLLLS
jgi:hypothetical protein